MGQWYMGRSEKFFDNAKEFRPERWLEPNIESASGKRTDEILKPFSLGPRNCVGKLYVHYLIGKNSSQQITVIRLALAEARLVIAKLLWHFDIELDGDHSTWVQDARFYVSIRSTRALFG
jgi:cytochrome P450